MDKLTRYRKIVTDAVHDYAAFGTPPGDVRDEVVIDPDRDRYAVVSVGWDGHRRIHYTVIHLDIIGDKIWVQHDATDRPVAMELVRAGVPRSDIVLGFHPAHVRPHTEFAVG